MNKKIIIGIASVIVVAIGIITATVGNGNDVVNKHSNVNQLTKVYDRTELEVGDYISYEYDEAEDYVLSSDSSGYVKDQTIKQTDLLWKILYIDDETGRVDLISHTSKDEKIYLLDAVGYNNGVYLINDICAKLYSNKELGITARSINLDDIENLFNDAGKDEKINYGSIKFGEAKTYTGENSYYPNLYAKENGAGIDSTETKKDGINASDMDNLVTDTYSQAINNGLTVTHSSYRIDNPISLFENSDVYQLLFEEGSYWVATRSVSCKENWASFGLMRVQQYAQTDVYLDNQALFTSQLNVSGSGGESGIRPIISINGDVEIIVNEGTISDMHTIKK